MEKIVGGGQAIGTLDDGRKAFVWGGLPKELVTIRVTKKKSHFVEGIVTEIIEKSPERITPKDENSYLSTSPWQIMPMSSEQSYKTLLIEEVFYFTTSHCLGKLRYFLTAWNLIIAIKSNSVGSATKRTTTKRKLWTWRFSNAAAREKLSLTEPAWHIQA